MEVILLERIAKLGQMGEVVRVKDGYARNFLLPKGKAMRANKANLERFARDRVQLEARNLERKSEAEEVAAKLGGQSFTAIRSAGETDQLYGSVSTRDIADVISENGFSVQRTQVQLNMPIKTLGLHQVAIALHPEVEAMVTVNVARSNEEAERQAHGEAVTLAREEKIEEQAAPALEELLEDAEQAREVAAELAEEEASEAAESKAEADAAPAEDEERTE
ncbi:MAG: 50S ribosomal protein L9 [Hyphomicrobiales bacterium]|nr:50S ribosomal protein L9 [Hyphomicrobiales bacterium]